MGHDGELPSDLPEDELEDLLPIREVALRTGVSAQTLRSWEQRHGLLVPQRSPQGHRLYSPCQVEQVRQIRDWVQRGAALEQVQSLISPPPSGHRGEFLQRFADDFASLDKHQLHRLGALYSPDVVFRDPLHEVHGLADLHRYFAAMYDNVQDLHFDFQGIDPVGAGEGYLRWTMSYRHPRLRRGEPIHLDGCSHLCWRDERVYRHHDYFDAGALLYEHLPVLGGTIAWLKRRLA